MKQFLPVVWWLTATLVIAFVLVGLGYLFADALLLGVLFLSGMLTARYFVPQLSFENRRQGILDTVYLALAILGIEYLSLMLGHAVVLGAGEGGMPGLLLNPPFILLVLTALIAPEIALEKHLERRCPYARSISFVSDRRKITLDPAEISYVESNDSEVWIHTAGGLAYRTKTRISQWETQLDSRFLRIHRSFIVNTARIDRCCPHAVRTSGSVSVPSAQFSENSRRAASRTAAARPEPPRPSPLRPHAQRTPRCAPRTPDALWAGPSGRCGGSSATRRSRSPPRRPPPRPA